jgi:hypothetical protein
MFKTCLEAGIEEVSAVYSLRSGMENAQVIVRIRKCL